ncbi:ABC transporter permease [Blastococcus mobilis]|uniref:Oligopeptide transport system permease protein OppC n=1 Tax=Blastococcus mobilis TaxID=1938746 RepID=A0A238UQX0_9ACTN|nr:ABC transporter permease [Blastococcus mobilis]SNR24408.1 peptide/nickel transport system permease protein [Blastococcus mobilis]
MSLPTDPFLAADHRLVPSAGGRTGAPEDVVVLGRRRLVLARLRRNRAAMAALVVLVLLVVAAVLGPVTYRWITGWGYIGQDRTALLQPPSAEHWFGTTLIGVDVFAQTLRGLQKSLLIGFLAAVISTGLAAVVGAFAGYLGGWVDRGLMWLVDLLLVIPAFLVVAVLGRGLGEAGWPVLTLLIALFAWMITARIVRGTTLSLREREFVLAARFSGVSVPGIVFRHLIPNMSSLLIIDATITVATAIIAESGLSYFGFGVRPPDVSLGSMIAVGTPSAFTSPWLFMFAGGLLVLTTLAVSVLGDGLRDALDPGSTRRAGR